MEKKPCIQIITTQKHSDVMTSKILYISVTVKKEKLKNCCTIFCLFLNVSKIIVFLYQYFSNRIEGDCNKDNCVQLGAFDL